MASKGLFNAVLAIFGIPGLAWLGDPATAIWTLILLVVWQFGSPMLIFLAGLKQIPTEYYEAAAMDGAGPWSKFIHITWPLLTPVIFFNLVMQTIYSFMTFTQAYVVTGGQPLDTTLFYNLYVFIRAFQTFDMGYGAAMAWVMLAGHRLLHGCDFQVFPLLGLLRSPGEINMANAQLQSLRTGQVARESKARSERSVSTRL